MSTIPRLFIYIPTFNRPKALSAQLRALLPQVAEHPDRVRLVISDNASEAEGNAELMRRRDYPANVSFRSNGGNVGANANISLGFLLAVPGEFLWILGDNDIVSDVAVKYVLDNLSYSADFFCFINDAEEPRRVRHRWEDGWQIPMDWRMGLISDGLYNFDTVKSSIGDAFKYHNSSFPHLAVACSAAKKKEIVDFVLLPRKNITAELASSGEQPTDYSLAHVGMPLLVPLFPAWEAAAFSILWVRRHGVDFYRNRSQHPDVFAQTRATLKAFGGWRVRVALGLAWLAFLLLPLSYPYTHGRRKLVAAAKAWLRPETVESLRNVRSRIFRK